MSQVVDQIVSKSVLSPPLKSISRYVQAVYSYCRRTLGDRELAQATAIAAFIAVYERQHVRFDAPGFQLQLFRVTRIACQTSLGPARHLRRSEEEAASMNTQPSSISPINWDLLRLLDAAIAKLRPVYRDVILLRYYGGKSCHEAAMELDLPPKAVQEREARALAMIRGYYASCGVDLSDGALVELLRVAFSVPVPLNLEETIRAALTDVGRVPVEVKRIAAATARQLDRSRGRRRPGGSQ